jgi:NAD+ synthase
MRKLDLRKEKENIIGFIQDYMHRSGLSKLVIGLSGGIDSSVCAALATEAIGKDNVTGVMLPYATSNPDSLQDAILIAEQLGIIYQVTEITPMCKPYFVVNPEMNQLRRGNWMARTRMCVLFDMSAKLPALVLGTSNRTELMVGYFTLYGDSACALEPIGHLYKTEVRGLAEILNIPHKIIQKVPSADLAVGQSDEADLGIDYPTLDKILYELTEQDLDFRSLENARFPIEQYAKVDKLIRSSAYKRQMPPMPEL